MQPEEQWVSTGRGGVVPNLSLQDVIDPRGRADRRGLAVLAAILIGGQVGIYGALIASGADLNSGPAALVHLSFGWLGLVAISKRMHDLGVTAWRLVVGAIGMIIWSVAGSLAILFWFGEEAVTPGGPGMIAMMAAAIIPLAAVTLWLHFARGDVGENRFGPVPGPFGFSMPKAARRAPNAAPIVRTA